MRVEYKSTPGGLLFGRVPRGISAEGEPLGDFVRVRPGVDVLHAGGTVFATSNVADFTPHPGPLRTNSDGEVPGWLGRGVYTTTDPVTGESITFDVGGSLAVADLDPRVDTLEAALPLVESGRGARTWATATAYPQFTILTDGTATYRVLVANYTSGASIAADVTAGKLAVLPGGTDAALIARLAVNVRDPQWGVNGAASTIGAQGDGTQRLLSAAFASLAAAQVVYPFVTALSQTQDWAAIEKARRSLPTPAGGIVEIPTGDYKLGIGNGAGVGFFWDNAPIVMRGWGRGFQPGTGTRLTFAANVAGFHIKHGVSGFGNGSRVEDMRLISLNTAAGTNDAIWLQSNNSRAVRVVGQNWGRHGLHILSAALGVPSEIPINANFAGSTDCQFTECWGDGFHTEGGDSNVCVHERPNASGCKGWGIYDTGTINNVYEEIHCASNAGYVDSTGAWNRTKGDVCLGPGSRGSTLVALYSETIGTNANVTAGSTLVTGVVKTGLFQDGDCIVGPGIPSETTVVSGGGTSTLTLSAPATITAFGVQLSPFRGFVETVDNGGNNKVSVMTTGNLVRTDRARPGNSIIEWTSGNLHQDYLGIGDGEGLDIRFDAKRGATPGVIELLRGTFSRWWIPSAGGNFTVRALAPDSLGRLVLQFLSGAGAVNNQIEFGNPIRINPSAAPDKAAVGTIYMTSAGVLRVCTVAGDTNPIAPTFATVGTQA